MRLYDPLFAATQRAARRPAAAAAGVGGAGKLPFYEKAIPLLHGAALPAGGAALGAGLTAAAGGDEDAVRDAAIGSGLMAAPHGILTGIQSHVARDFVRKGVQQGAMFGDPLRDFARRAQGMTDDPHLRQAMQDVADGNPFLRELSMFGRMSPNQRVNHAFRQGAAAQSPVAGQTDALLDELRKEFPGMKDRQIAGRIHPDQRPKTEAPAAALDDAYRALASRRSPAAAASGSPSSMDDVAKQVQQEARQKGVDFLRSFKLGLPEGLGTYTT